MSSHFGRILDVIKQSYEHRNYSPHSGEPPGKPGWYVLAHVYVLHVFMSDVDFVKAYVAANLKHISANVYSSLNL
jgi:hypothetical protein